MHWRSWRTKLPLLIKVSIFANPFITETVIKCQSYILIIFKPFFSGADENEVNSQKSKGNIPLNLKFKGNGKNVFLLFNCIFQIFRQVIREFIFHADDTALYESLKEYVLSEEKLVESNFPVQHPEKPGCAVLFVDNKKGHADRKWNQSTTWCYSHIVSLEGTRYLCGMRGYFLCTLYSTDVLFRLCLLKPSRGSAADVVLRTLWAKQASTFVRTSVTTTMGKELQRKVSLL